MIPNRPQTYVKQQVYYTITDAQIQRYSHILNTYYSKQCLNYCKYCSTTILQIIHL